MSDYKNEPAFPASACDTGLTRLEYFAGQALEGLCANPNVVAESIEDIARWSFNRAEAMCAEAEKRRKAAEDHQRHLKAHRINPIPEDLK